MPRSPHNKDVSLRIGLTAAAARLREVDSPDLAGFVDAALAPNGWGRLRRSEAAESGSGTEDKTRSIRMTPAERTHLYAAANAAEDNLAEEGNHILEEFVQGRFLPDRPAPSPYGSGTDKVSMSLILDSGLWEQAETLGKGLQAELGWRPAPSAVVRAGLMLKYPMPATTAAE
jgi:hypothetical protein